ncbi:PC-esterase domain-containing protein 1A [Genypterus blacodes]|uniref:PC-esterase domain-containing protein 1A n=1 Tax=Genypterus blacodes TaxID=154954 RepID=UPI003F76D881
MDPQNGWSHEQATKLLHNKFVVVLGDSIQRSVYKDLVLLLQKDTYLSVKQLKSKGELRFEQDCLFEGGSLGQMHNGTQYKEARQFQSNNHLVRFYFVTRIYSPYMQSIFSSFRHGFKPDIVIINSCIWDISRYETDWNDDYTANLHKVFNEMKRILPKETLVIWNLTMPLGTRTNGGFLVPEIEHKASHMRSDVISANFHSGTLADAYGMDVLDLHFHFRLSLQHRNKDGIHWNAIAHRVLTCLLLTHIAKAWGVKLACPPAQTAGLCPPPILPLIHLNCPKEVESGNLRKRQQQKYLPERRAAYQPHNKIRPCWPVLHYQHQNNLHANSFIHTPAYHFVPYGAPSQHQHFVMRSLHLRHHYAPYTHHRPSQHPHQGHSY